jgi:hypothetical protein
MHFTMVLANISASEAQVVCEPCRVAESPGHEGWQHYLEEVEEVEISWANGDQRVVKYLSARQSFALCPSCVVQHRLQDAVITRQGLVLTVWLAFKSILISPLCTALIRRS